MSYSHGMKSWMVWFSSSKWNFPWKYYMNEESHSMNFTTNKTAKTRMFLRPFWGVLLIMLVAFFLGNETAFGILEVFLPFVIFLTLLVFYFNNDVRWLKRLIMTILVSIGFLTGHSLLICGCHFSLFAVPVLFVPISWAIYVNCNCTDRKERFVGYAAIVMALLAFLFGFMSNLIFLFE